MELSLDDILKSHRTRRPVVMGILNVTADSFSDGGQFLDPSAAIDHARQMLQEGAAIIDIGAESTRPGAARISADQQLARLEKVLPAVTSTGAIVSVDTTLSAVAEFALDSGAAIINDISAGTEDPRMLPLVANRGAAIVLMHMLGQPANMQKDPQYRDVVEDIHTFLADRLAAAASAGIDKTRCILDVGIGFGKTLRHNLDLLANLDRFSNLDCPLLIGPSRKQFISRLTGAAGPQQRLGGTIAACLAAFQRGATIFRVHDVSDIAQALAIAAAVENSRRR